jgi:translation elongation factor EF-G
VKFGGPTEALPRSTIHADIPLRELVGYASTLRSITAGEASLSMELHGYREVETGRTAILLAEE